MKFICSCSAFWVAARAFSLLLSATESYEHYYFFFVLSLHFFTALHSLSRAHTLAHTHAHLCAIISGELPSSSLSLARSISLSIPKIDSFSLRLVFAFRRLLFSGRSKLIACVRSQYIIYLEWTFNASGTKWILFLLLLLLLRSVSFRLICVQSSVARVFLFVFSFRKSAR